MEKVIDTYKNWKFKNTFMLILSLVLVFIFANSQTGKLVIHNVSQLGYVGSFIAGIFFVSTFTVAPSGIVLFNMAQTYNPILISISAGLGAVIGDYIIFRFLKDGVFEEIKPIFMKLGGSYWSQIINTPYFAWLAPFIGAIIIASPFPDEIGVSLMGISKLKNWQFIAISFILNSLGILFIVTLAKSV